MSSINKKLASGVLYTASAKYIGILFQIVIGAILARLLTPEEFGIVALVTVFVTFFNLLSDFGIGSAVVQNQELKDNDVQSIFLFSIIIGFVLAGIFFYSAPIISKFYEEPALINVSRLLALSVLLHSLQIIPKATIQKELKFKQLGIINVVVQVFCGFIAIILALRGFSYYSLVINSVLNGFFSLLIFYFFSNVEIKLSLKISSVKKIINFSSYNFLFNFINYFSRNGDNILIGKFLGSEALGFYDKSYRLMLLPVQNLTHVFTPVLMPLLSKHQNDKDLVYKTYLKVVRVLSTIGFPLSIFLFFSSYELINIVYGSQWDQSIPVFKVLSLTIGIQIVYSTAGSIFQVVDRTDLLFYYGVIGAIVLLSGISYGIFIGKGLVAVGYGLLFAFSLNFLIVFYILIKIALKKSLAPFFKTLIIPFVSSFSVGISLWFYSTNATDILFLDLLINLLLSLIIGFLIPLLDVYNRKIYRKYYNILMDKIYNFK